MKLRVKEHLRNVLHSQIQQLDRAIAEREKLNLRIDEHKHLIRELEEELKDER